MYQSYQHYKIVLYYTKETEKFIGWAKTFWLLKTAHPLIAVQIEDNYLKNPLDPAEWLKTYLPQCQNLQALFVPTTIRPLVEIDFLTDSHSYNRYSTCLDSSPCICYLEQSSSFEPVPLTGIFEDLSLPDGLATIIEEISLIKEKLLMNI